MLSSIPHCRICRGQRLHSVLDLGRQALTGVFRRKDDPPVPVYPVELVKCDEETGGCGLVQLRHSAPLCQMYGDNYGYRSGLNSSMVAHLKMRVQKVCALARPSAGDLILDIGSNDSTTLQAYPHLGLQLVGMDPSGVKFRRFYPPHVTLIPDFFSADAFTAKMQGEKAKIVTSIAMFYDLEDPQAFMADVHRVLADDGVWVFEQSYCPTMLEANAYDTICHEHLSYYALRQIKWMTDRAGFKIIDVELNDSNGGSFCVSVAKQGSSYEECTPVIEGLLEDEERAGLSGLRPFTAFRNRVFKHKDQLRATLAELRAKGMKVYGYGASTKGNVVLQHCGLTAQDIPAIAEVNPDKFGTFTPATNIPILSEEEVRLRKPDCLLVLPWHFRKNTLRREADFLNSGGRLLFPLPEIEITGTGGYLRASA